VLAGEREQKAGNSHLLFQLGEVFSQDTVLPGHLGPFPQHQPLVQCGATAGQGLGVTKPGLEEGEGLSRDPERASYLWLYGSLQRWKDCAATLLALQPCPPLSLPPLLAESEPDSSLHLNPLRVRVIHLFCGATPVLLSLLILR